MANNRAMQSDPLIVVTGAAGFIGRNVVAALNASGRDNVLLVDTLGTDDKWRNLLGLRFEDLLSPQAFIEALESHRLPGIAGIIHEGACSATTERDADFLLDNNYRYTRRLCQWCLHAGARFVHASSAATYGDGSMGYGDDDAVTPTLTPLNMYGYSKHLFDVWALRHGLFDRIAGLKYFNVYGPYEAYKGDMRSVVHKSFHKITETGKVGLFRSHRPDYRDGHQLRDFIYVKDVVDVTLWFFDRPEKNGLFNCGTGEARTWLDLAKATFAAMDRPENIEFIDMTQGLRDRYQYFTQAEIGKLRAAGYDKPFTSLEDGVTDYVRNHLAIPGHPAR